MRRGIQIRVAFAPTRLSAEHLHSAYEMVLPLVERSVEKKADAVAHDDDREQSSVRRRQRKAQ